MRFHTTDIFGMTYPEPDSEQLREVLGTLVDADLAEHPDVSLVHENGIILTVTASGKLLWEEGERVRYVLKLESPEEALPAWEALARDDLAELKSLPWNAWEDGELP